jgi:hypothetical protein
MLILGPAHTSATTYQSTVLQTIDALYHLAERYMRQRELARTQVVWQW